MAALRYHYRPLEASQIRCTRVLPAEDQNDAIVIELQHKSIDAVDTEYHALSYTWGERDPQHEAHFSDEPGSLVIRDNCWRFLKHSRKMRFDPSAWLWIDAICINQDDTPEKGVQVQKMAEIFHRAESVLMWLGIASEDDYFLQIVSLAFEDHIADVGYLEFWRSQAWHSELSTMYSNSVAFCHLDEIIGSDYWTRLWVIQELTFARALRCIIGSRFYSVYALLEITSLHYDVLFHNWHRWRQTKMILDHILGEDAQNNEVMSGRTGISHIERVLECSYPGGCQKTDMNLETVLNRFCDQLCDEPLDKVYGLLGLLKSSHMFEVDYKLLGEQLFMRIMDIMLLEQAEECNVLLDASLQWADVDTAWRVSVDESRNISYRPSRYKFLDDIEGDIASLPTLAQQKFAEHKYCLALDLVASFKRSSDIDKPWTPKYTDSEEEQRSIDLRVMNGITDDGLELTQDPDITEIYVLAVCQIYIFVILGEDHVVRDVLFWHGHTNPSYWDLVEIEHFPKTLRKNFVEDLGSDPSDRKNKRVSTLASTTLMDEPGLTTGLLCYLSAREIVQLYCFVAEMEEQFSQDPDYEPPETQRYRQARRAERRRALEARLHEIGLPRNEYLNGANACDEPLLRGSVGAKTFVLD